MKLEIGKRYKLKSHESFVEILESTKAGFKAKLQSGIIVTYSKDGACLTHDMAHLDLDGSPERELPKSQAKAPDLRSPEEIQTDVRRARKAKA